MPSLYTSDTLKFFRGIKRNPRKEWYEANKPLYRSAFYDASSLLIDSLKKSPEFRALGLQGSAKQGIFRLHRDLRFSHNKSPYKHHGSFIMSRSGSKKDPGVFYFHLEPGGASGLYMGYWQLDPKHLNTFREWIVAHPNEYLKNVEERLRSRKLEFSSDYDLKRLPRGYQLVPNEALHPALKRRGFGVWEALSDAELTDPKLESRIRNFVKRASPVLLWGESVIGD